MKIQISTSSFASMDNTPMERLIDNGFEIINNPFKRKLTKKEILELLSDNVVGLIAGLEPLDREVLEKSKLKVISRVGSGLSNIDLDAANELGIKVCYTPYGPTTAVAELTIGAMLTLIRMVPPMDRALHQGKWDKKIGFQLQDKTVTIIGYGRIGKKVAELLQTFNVNIIIVDPFIENKVKSYPVLSLNEALPKSDIITIHSFGTECLLGEIEFSLLKKGVFLLNSARGGLISEFSLIRALDDGKISGAWIDTFEDEPYSGSLTKYENVILTPHIGSYTFECRKQMETEAVENLINTLKLNY